MRPTVLFLVLLAGAAAGCSVIRGERGNKGQITFSHSQHVEQADCADCHGGVQKSGGPTRGQYIQRGHAGCANCHEQEIKDKCQKCHRGPKEGVQLTRVDRKLTFSHARHGTLVKSCNDCHPKEKQAGALVPGHPTCNVAGCHRRTFKVMECQSCHQDLQRFGSKPVGFLAHGADFVRQHGPMARQASRACAQCHDQTYCADCHQAGTAPAPPSVIWPERVERQFIHRGDFVSRHMIEAQAQPQSCFKCHGQRSCRACHALNGLAAAPLPGVRGGITRSYHPAGWTTPGSAEHHGSPARRDIRRCASCHDRGTQSNCVGCHRVGGTGGNPHPPGWSRRDKTAQCLTANTCAACHPGGQGCR